MLLLLLSPASSQEDGMVLTLFKIFHNLVAPNGDFEDIIRMKEQFVAEKQLRHTYDPDSLPYFKIMPKYVTTLAPNTTEDILGTCFGSVQVDQSSKMLFSF